MEHSLYTFRRDLPAQFNTGAVIVIDTHNFTSTVVQALANGAKGVIPITEGVPEEVELVADDWENEFSNHPEDMHHPRVEENYIGIASMNGAPAVHTVNANGNFDELYLASLTNAKYVAETVLENHDEVTFVLSGSDGHASPEDALTASYIAHQIDAGIKDELKEMYVKLNDILVEGMYDFIYDDWGLRKELGTPETHAFEHVRELDSIETVPVLRGRYFKPLSND